MNQERLKKTCVGIAVILAVFTGGSSSAQTGLAVSPVGNPVMEGENGGEVLCVQGQLFRSEVLSDFYCCSDEGANVVQASLYKLDGEIVHKMDDWDAAQANGPLLCEALMYAVVEGMPLDSEKKIAVNVRPFPGAKLTPGTHLQRVCAEADAPCLGACGDTCARWWAKSMVCGCLCDSADCEEEIVTGYSRPCCVAHDDCCLACIKRRLGVFSLCQLRCHVQALRNGCSLLDAVSWTESNSDAIRVSYHHCTLRACGEDEAQH